MTDTDARRREAAEWFTAIHSTDEPSADLLQAWLQWFESSPENRSAFEDVARIWHSITPALIAQHSAGSGDEDYDGSIPIAEWRSRAAGHTRSAAGAHFVEHAAEQRAGVEEISVARSRSAWSRRRRWTVSLLAACAVLSVGMFMAREQLMLLQGTNHVVAGEFVTGTGEHLDLMLADGSRVTLGSQSRFSVDFTKAVRAVRLDAGEAYFSVRKDPSRPFTVHTLDGVITAVGTAFNVRALQDRVTVTVTEGVVRIDEPSADLAAAVLERTTQIARHAERSVARQLARGEQLTYRSIKGSGSALLESAVVKHVDPSESMRWRSGWLVYRNEPLGYVIADIARYTDLKIVVTDSAAKLQFSGAVFKDRIPEWIVALPEVSMVTVSEDGDRMLIATPPSVTSVNR